MLRSVFFAVGIFLLILGVQSLIVDKIVMTNRSQLPQFIAGNSNLGQRGSLARIGNSPFRTAGYRGPFKNLYSNADQNGFDGFKRIYQTKDWMPWSLLAAGTVIVLYTYSLGGSKE